MMKIEQEKALFSYRVDEVANKTNSCRAFRSRTQHRLLIRDRTGTRHGLHHFHVSQLSLCACAIFFSVSKGKFSQKSHQVTPSPSKNCFTIFPWVIPVSRVHTVTKRIDKDMKTQVRKRSHHMGDQYSGFVLITISSVHS